MEGFTTSLPTEIHGMIFSRLDKADLISIAGVSRFWRDKLLPKIFHSLCLRFTFVWRRPIIKIPYDQNEDHFFENRIRVRHSRAKEVLERMAEPRDNALDIAPLVQELQISVIEEMNVDHIQCLLLALKRLSGLHHFSWTGQTLPAAVVEFLDSPQRQFSISLNMEFSGPRYIKLGDTGFGTAITRLTQILDIDLIDDHEEYDHNRCNPTTHEIRTLTDRHWRFLRTLALDGSSMFKLSDQIRRRNTPDVATNLTRAVFSFALQDLVEAGFANAYLGEAGFEGAHPGEVGFEDADPHGAEFEGADLHDVGFEDLDPYEVIWSGIEALLRQAPALESLTLINATSLRVLPLGNGDLPRLKELKIGMDRTLDASFDSPDMKELARVIRDFVFHHQDLRRFDFMMWITWRGQCGQNDFQENAEWFSLIIDAVCSLGHLTALGLTFPGLLEEDMQAAVDRIIGHEGLRRTCRALRLGGLTDIPMQISLVGFSRCSFLAASSGRPLEDTRSRYEPPSVERLVSIQTDSSLEQVCLNGRLYDILRADTDETRVTVRQWGKGRVRNRDEGDFCNDDGYWLMKFREVSERNEIARSFD